MSDEVSVLSPAEAAAVDAQLNELYGGDPGVNALLASDGSEYTDGRNRTIITFRQYQELSRQKRRLDNYMLKMKGPTGIGLVQASKYIKWYGLGYRPVEDQPRTVGIKVPESEVTIYWCRERYPDCKRFFDSERARETHWGMQHEKIQRKKARKAKENEFNGEE